MAYKDEVYWLERGSIAISTKSPSPTSPDDEYGGPVADKTVTVFAVKKGDPFVSADSGAVGETGLNNSPNIPTEFHESIVYKAIQKAYEMNPETIQVASYWDNKFREAIIEAKKMANIANDATSPRIIGEDF